MSTDTILKLVNPICYAMILGSLYGAWHGYEAGENLTKFLAGFHAFVAICLPIGINNMQRETFQRVANRSTMALVFGYTYLAVMVLTLAAMGWFWSAGAWIFYVISIIWFRDKAKEMINAG